MLVKSFSRFFSSAVVKKNGFTLPLKKFEYHKLDNILPKTCTITKEEALKYYHDMVAIRLMENEAGKLYMEKAIKGFCHLYTGQESCAVGIEAVISKDDSVITAYRSHGWTYTRGRSIASILCELTGKSSGCSQGKGGSMHTYAHEFYGGNGIVGAQVPVGTGIALAHKLKKNGHVCVTLYGDGAANQGQVFEAFNISALWKLPVIYVCENNLFAMGTSIERASACNEFYTRGDYIPGIKVDASCILSVKEAIAFCYNWCRNEKGPIVVELMTYRYSGHSMSDPGTSYRKLEDVQVVRKTKDPISYFTNQIIESGMVSESELDAIKEQLENEVEEAKKLALTDKFPNVETLGEHIYQGGTKSGYARGCDVFTQYNSSL